MRSFCINPMIGGSLLRTQLNPQIAQVRKRCFDKTVQLVKESTNSRIKTRRQNNLPSENGWLKAGSLALDVGSLAFWLSFGVSFPGQSLPEKSIWFCRFFQRFFWTKRSENVRVGKQNPWCFYMCFFPEKHKNKSCCFWRA